MKLYAWAWFVCVVCFLLGCDGSSTGESFLEEENTAEMCRDSEDNDGDELTDCADDECAMFTFCEGFVDTSSTDSGGDSDSPDGTETESGTESDSEAPPDCEVGGCTGTLDNICDNEGNLVVYSGASTCVDHVCQYEFIIELCEKGCYPVEGGPDKCKEDLCVDVVCSVVEDMCNNDPEYQGWLGLGVPQLCDPSTGLCVIDATNPDIVAKDCGGPDKCISVSGGNDYCDTDSN